jgi:lysozyme family protein
MAQTIDQILDKLVSKKVEGGYANKKGDPGGPTKYGITQKTLSDYRGKKVTIKDVQNLSVDEAKKIYRKSYYHDTHIDQLPADLQPIVLDSAVLHGPQNGIRMLQTALNQKGYKVDADGLIGATTVAQAQAAAKQNSGGVINSIVDQRVARVQQRVKDKPDQKKFLNGWTTRAKSFQVPIPPPAAGKPAEPKAIHVDPSKPSEVNGQSSGDDKQQLRDAVRQPSGTDDQQQSSGDDQQQQAADSQQQPGGDDQQSGDDQQDDDAPEQIEDDDGQQPY